MNQRKLEKEPLLLSYFENMKSIQHDISSGQSETFTIEIILLRSVALIEYVHCIIVWFEYMRIKCMAKSFGHHGRQSRL